MDMIPVSSSDIASVGYENGTLYISITILMPEFPLEKKLQNALNCNGFWKM